MMSSVDPVHSPVNGGTARLMGKVFGVMSSCMYVCPSTITCAVLLFVNFLPSLMPLLVLLPELYFYATAEVHGDRAARFDLKKPELKTVELSLSQFLVLSIFPVICGAVGCI